LQYDITGADVTCIDTYGICVPPLKQLTDCLTGMGAQVVLSLRKAPLYGLVTITSNQDLFYQPLVMLLDVVKNDSLQVDIRYKFPGEAGMDRLSQITININRKPAAGTCVYGIQDEIIDLTDSEPDALISPPPDADCPYQGFLIPFWPENVDCTNSNFGISFIPLGQTNRSGTFCWGYSYIVYTPDETKAPANDTLRIEFIIRPMAVARIRRCIIKRL